MPRSCDDTITKDQQRLVAGRESKSRWVNEALRLSDRLLLLFKRLAAGAAFLFIGMYISIAVSRMTYPFQLEWLESGCLDMVRQVLSPEPLYVAPSIHYMPFVYAPLYFYVSAPLAQLFGVGFTTLRLVSFLASLGCFAMLYLLAKRETDSPSAGILAAGLFAATYMWSGGWFDLARVDSLALFLLLASVLALRTEKGTASMVGAAVVLWLSFLTKQSALAIAIPLIAYAVLASRRTGIIFAGTFLGLAAASTLMLDTAYDGWYSYYVFQLPGQHPIVAEMLLGFWIQDIMVPLFVALALSALLIIYTWRTGRRTQAVFYAALLAGCMGAAWVSRVHQGGYANVLLPAYASLALMFGIGIAQLPTLFPSRSLRGTSTAGVALLSLALLQFAALTYSPLLQLPSSEERAASEQLQDYIRGVDGEVFAPAHSYMLVDAGKQSYAHTAAIWDVLRGDESIHRATLIGELRRLIAGQEFDALVAESPPWVLPELTQYYAYTESLPLPFDAEVEMWPGTAKMVRPEGIYLPVPQDQGNSSAAAK